MVDRSSSRRLAHLDRPASKLSLAPQPAALDIAPPQSHTQRRSTLALTRVLVEAMRPAQWLKNGVVFAGLVFGSRLFELPAVAAAVFAAAIFCLLSSGFYLINDVRDVAADRLHPIKRRRPVAAGQLPTGLALAAGIALVTVALLASAALGTSFVVVAICYAVLMCAYNLGLKHVVIIDVLVIAIGFVLRAVAGAIAVDVSISPWLLVCTLLLALLIGFGKRRHELVALERASEHRRNLESYSERMLDQAVAVTAAGTLLAYAVYTFDSKSAPTDHRFMLTVPIVAYGVFRYLYLLYQQGQGGSPESMLVSDRALLAAVGLWSIASAALFYLPR